MFVDEVVVKVIAGQGGDGCTSFRREKRIPRGGPDGASGGAGSNIIFEVDSNLKTLVDLKYHKIIKGKKGSNGRGSNQTGAQAPDIVIKVPPGTSIYVVDTGQMIADLTSHGERFIVAYGGRGGRGNRAFATPTNPAPKISEYGEPGEIKLIKCELKVMADVGLIGMPSVGKSTLLAAISAAKPEVGSYHFTTLTPNLGVVTLKDNRSFIVADLPGLIKGASQGIGLGDRFLRHAMRTKILAQVIDMGASENRDPIQDYEIIQTEIEKYSPILANKFQIIVANKMDLPGALKNLKRFKGVYPHLEVYEISAQSKIGLSKLLTRLADLLTSLNESESVETDRETEVLFKYPEKGTYQIRKDNDIWIIEGADIEKLFRMTKFDETESTSRFAHQLKKMGVEAKLEQLGAKSGDTVQILDYLFVFKN